MKNSLAIFFLFFLYITNIFSNNNIDNIFFQNFKNNNLLDKSHVTCINNNNSLINNISCIMFNLETIIKSNLDNIINISYTCDIGGIDGANEYDINCASFYNSDKNKFDIINKFYFWDNIKNIENFQFIVNNKIDYHNLSFGVSGNTSIYNIQIIGQKINNNLYKLEKISIYSVFDNLDIVFSRKN